MRITFRTILGLGLNPTPMEIGLNPTLATIDVFGLAAGSIIFVFLLKWEIGNTLLQIFPMHIRCCANLVINPSTPLSGPVARNELSDGS